MSTDDVQESPLAGEAYRKKLPKAKSAYVVDFFCGCGGMSWGFANTRQSHWAFDVLAGIDLDRASLATYRKNLQTEAVNHDVARIAKDPASLVELVPNFDPETCRPLVFIGCAPC